MKILITGSSGMLGSALCQELADKHELVGMDIAGPTSYILHPTSFVQCDIADREGTITEIVSAKPDMVIHTAAYTDVDGCEAKPEKADEVNALGTETVALACQKSGAFLIYISTDFVFGGKKETPYLEQDLPNPINVYGRSKLAGEKFVQSILEKFIIVRSSWLFGRGGRNFVDTLLKKAQTEKTIEVVKDQFGAPTYTEDLARGIGSLIAADTRSNGIYHITNSGSCSWYELAQEIKEITNLDANIVPISSEQHRTSTRRPEMSILENRRYQELTGETLRPWKEALKEYLLG